MYLIGGMWGLWRRDIEPSFDDGNDRHDDDDDNDGTEKWAMLLFRIERVGIGLEWADV